MSVVKIASRVFRLKEPTHLNIGQGIDFKGGEEIEVVMDVVYMRGFMLPPSLQNYMFTWITGNPELFDDDTRR